MTSGTSTQPMSLEPAIGEISLTICHRPVFVIGSPRSGTTALAQALARHSQLHAGEESNFLWDLFAGDRLRKNYQRKELGGSWLQNHNIPESEFLRLIGVGINALLTSQSNGKRWVDHTPIYTLLVNELAGMFPGAFFVHMLRDGVRTVNSMIHYRNRIPKDKWAEMLKHWEWVRDFGAACRRWNQWVETALDFCDAHPERSMTVVNEQLTADPEKGFRQLLERLGLPYEPSPAHYYSTVRINSSFELHTGRALKISELPQPWREWTDEQKKTFLEECGCTMARCGLGVGDDARPADYLYRQWQDRVVALARPVTGGEARVLVVSKGDDGLLARFGSNAWHFPRTEEGWYSGHYPGDSTEAIAQLEQLRGKGAEYIVFPDTSMWWLDHYAEFRRHLDQRYTLAAGGAGDACLVYRLRDDGVDGQRNQSATAAAAAVGGS